ncbi:unnamed protein product [Sphagnum jensenii]|uniref:Uncharacterized protein n=1 Tax=Sphagnum jensenii TaxID=128206 RepID=A0ABP0VFC8_9BRYO
MNIQDPSPGFEGSEPTRRENLDFYEDVNVTRTRCPCFCDDKQLDVCDWSENCPTANSHAHWSLIEDGSARERRRSMFERLVKSDLHPTLVDKRRLLTAKNTILQITDDCLPQKFLIYNIVGRGGGGGLHGHGLGVGGEWGREVGGTPLGRAGARVAGLVNLPGQGAGDEEDSREYAGHDPEGSRVDVEEGLVRDPDEGDHVPDAEDEDDDRVEEEEVGLHVVGSAVADKVEEDEHPGYAGCRLPV